MEWQDFEQETASIQSLLYRHGQLMFDQQGWFLDYDALEHDESEEAAGDIG